MFRFTLALIGAMLCIQGAAAQDYPNRPIRFLQGFAPGGNADTIARVLAKARNRPAGASSTSEGGRRRQPRFGRCG